MKLPPLTALYYFSVVARAGSLVAAANQLYVTEGAVSRQMKLLAGFYGKPIFSKKGRSLVLTEQGQLLATTVSAAFESISQVSDQLLADERLLTISVTTSFAIRWLLPKLSDFERQFPQFPVQIQASSSQSALQGKNFDIQISYYLAGCEPLALQQDKLQDEWLMAVCAPSYLESSKLAMSRAALNSEEKNARFSLEQLCEARLLLNEMTGRDWRLWGDVLKLDKIDSAINNALKFEQDDVAIQAAVAGLGVSLANTAYIQNELALGTLVAATNQTAIVAGAHYLSIDKNRERSKAVEAFTQWIRNCAKN